jgi:predicted glycosyltransferase
MKILFYCQHVLGVGHFFRVLEICRAFKDDDVILVTGGEDLPAALPRHVRQVKLQGLMMDEAFSALYSVDPSIPLDAAKHNRKEALMALFKAESPDLFLVELYPFGRKAFRFELDPVLIALKNGTLPPARVICSLRDILVEKKDAAAYEERVISTLNRFFDALLIHADPGFIRLEETFSKVSDIRIPIRYTGFVTPRPTSDARERVRALFRIAPTERWIVVSAGGGKVGAPLLKAVVQAFPHLSPNDAGYRLHLLTGPYLEAGDEADLKKAAGADPRIQIERFSSEFLDLLAAADLSVSMGGYNTVMNLLAVGIPALIYPFDQNREQRMRAERLQPLGALSVMDASDLDPVTLAHRMANALNGPRRPTSLNLDGANQTARHLSELFGPLTAEKEEFPQ